MMAKYFFEEFDYQEMNVGTGKYLQKSIHSLLLRIQKKNATCSIMDN